MPTPHWNRWLTMNELIERLRAVQWDEVDNCDRTPDDPTHKCVFVDMRPAEFQALLREAAAALEAAREDARVLRQALKKVAQSLEWHAHGRCRGFDDGAPLPTGEAVTLAERTLAKVCALRDHDQEDHNDRSRCCGNRKEQV
jgi:hypothetical protein